MSYQVRLVDAGRSKIQVIKTVREIAGCGLREAKAIVDELDVVLSTKSAVAARSAQDALLSAGAKVKLLPEWTKAYYAYDPRAGSGQSIIMIVVVDALLETWEGSLGERYLLSGKEQERRIVREELSSGEAALEEASRRALALQRKGLMLAESEQAAYQALVARSDELEARLREHPDEQEAYQVYADWLIEQGDIRGELISCALADEARGASLLDVWLPAHRGAVLGPLARYTPWMELEWARGFIRRVRVAAVRGDFGEGLIAHLLSSPLALLLERLSVSVELAQAVDAHLGEEGLQSLELGYSWDLPEAALRAIRALAARVTRLQLGYVQVTEPQVLSLRSERLHTLELEVGGRARELQGLARSELPQLRRLSITHNTDPFEHLDEESGSPEAWQEGWTALCAKRFPRLWELELRDLWMLPEELLQSSFFESVEWLVLSGDEERPDLCAQLLAQESLLEGRRVYVQSDLVPIALMDAIEASSLELRPLEQGAVR